MCISSCVRRALPIVLAVAVQVGVCSTSFAGDVFEDKDFTLRFSAAMSRFSTYGDVAGVGGASAGSRWSSSINPAATAWLDIEQPLNSCVAGQFSDVLFSRGQRLDVFAESYTLDIDNVGTFLIAAAQIHGNNETMNNGLDFHFAGDIYQVIYAVRPADLWALGFTFKYTKSVGRNSLGTMEYAKSNSDTYDLTAGTLFEITEQLLAGVAVSYGWSYDRTIILGTRTTDITRQILVRPGVSYEYMDDCTVYVDYQYGRFWNDTGILNAHRIYGGVEHALTEWLYVRGGTAIDPCEGSQAWTGGLGIYPTDWLSIELAYQYNMFPELTVDFGRAQVINVSVGIVF